MQQDHDSTDVQLLRTCQTPDHERILATTKPTLRPSMNIKPIRDDKDLNATFKRLEQVFHADDGTAEADEMEVLVTLIEAYEKERFPIGPVDPVEDNNAH